MTVPQMPQTQTTPTTRATQSGAVSARSALDTIRMRRDLDLMNAAFTGDTARVRELVGKGANVNAADGGYGFTPLMWAARNGHVGAVRYLLGRGAKINARSKTGVRLVFDARTPTVTYETGSTLNLMLVSERGGVSALAIATANGWGMAARELIRRGADVNLSSPDGDTPLMAAAFNGDVETMKALLARGAKINALDVYGHSALWLAALRGQETAARELLVRGAKPSPDSGGTWPSDAAKAMQMKGVAILLARAERGPRAAMKKGVRTPVENREESRDNVNRGVPTADRAMTGEGGIIVLN